jgi:hypothetical protein
MRFQRVGVTRRGLRRVVASGAIVALSGAAVVAVGSGANVGAESNYVRTCLQGLGERHITHLNAPLVDIALTGTGHGCWLVGADGGVFSFGDAHYYGSASDLGLVSPVVGLEPTPDGHGYWLYASDGGVFNFGDAGYFGSAGGTARANPIVGMRVTHGGDGYSLTDSAGKVYRFVDPAPPAGSIVRATQVARKIDAKAARKAAHKAARKATRVRIHIHH